MITCSRSSPRLHFLRVGLVLALSLLACGCAGVMTPNNPGLVQPRQALLQQARQEYAQGHDQKALVLYSRVAEKNPGNPEIHFNRGCCFLRLNKCTAALSAFQNSVKLDPDAIRYRVNLSRACICLGRHERAL